MLLRVYTRKIFRLNALKQPLFFLRVVSKKNIPKKLFLEVSKLLFFGIKIKKTTKQQIFFTKIV